MAKQSAVFLQVYILPDKVESLAKLLNQGGNPSKSGSFFPLEKIKSVHFARWLIAPATDKFKASVLYSANIDGTVEDHLNDLVAKLSDGIDAIFEHCEGYPSADQRTDELRLKFLNTHSFTTPTFYVGAPNRSVQQIEKESALHDAVREYSKAHSHEWKNSKQAYKAIQEFVKSDSQWSWAQEHYALPKKQGFKMILFLALVAVLLPFLIMGIIGIFLFYELWSKPIGKSINEVPLDRMKTLKDQEDIIYQNQLSQVFETKGGLRKLMLKFMLWATNYAAKNWFVEGQLMGTPTIHFARWVFIDGGKRFVFFSNFDGSYDGYLGDFVDNNGWGLNAIYGAAKGYPRTLFMFGKGSYKMLEFLGWGRMQQVPTPIWYSAYPWQGLQQIISNSALRVELCNEPPKDEAGMKQTLRRI